MSLGHVSDELIAIGPEAMLDPPARVGECSTRPVTGLPLRIGGARIRSGSTMYAESYTGARFNTAPNAVVREEDRVGDLVSIWDNSTDNLRSVVDPPLAERPYPPASPSMSEGGY